MPEHEDANSSSSERCSPYPADHQRGTRACRARNAKARRQTSTRLLRGPGFLRRGTFVPSGKAKLSATRPLGLKRAGSVTPSMQNQQLRSKCTMRMARRSAAPRYKPRCDERGTERRNLPPGISRNPCVKSPCSKPIRSGTSARQAANNAMNRLPG